MNTNNARRYTICVCHIAAACFFTIGAAGAYADDITAAPAAASAVQVQADVDLAALEKAFWRCDYAATIGGIDATPVAVCSAITDELKGEKFGGDFLAMLQWWQTNKPVEHRKLVAESGAADAAK